MGARVRHAGRLYERVGTQLNGKITQFTDFAVSHDTLAYWPLGTGRVRADKYTHGGTAGHRHEKYAPDQARRRWRRPVSLPRGSRIANRR
jgi:hypothetical protein